MKEQMVEDLWLYSFFLTSASEEFGISKHLFLIWTSCWLLTVKIPMPLAHHKNLCSGCRWGTGWPSSVMYRTLQEKKWSHFPATLPWDPPDTHTCHRQVATKAAVPLPVAGAKISPTLSCNHTPRGAGVTGFETELLFSLASTLCIHSLFPSVTVFRQGWWGEPYSLCDLGNISRTLSFGIWVVVTACRFLFSVPVAGRSKRLYATWRWPI